MLQFLRAGAFGCLFAIGISDGSAQELGNLAEDIPDGAQMLLEADVLTYDQQANTVSASGACAH